MRLALILALLLSTPLMAEEENIPLVGAGHGQSPESRVRIQRGESFESEVASHSANYLSTLTLYPGNPTLGPFEVDVSGEKLIVQGRFEFIRDPQYNVQVVRLVRRVDVYLYDDGGSDILAMGMSHGTEAHDQSGRVVWHNEGVRYRRLYRTGGDGSVVAASLEGGNVVRDRSDITVPRVLPSPTVWLDFMNEQAESDGTRIDRDSRGRILRCTGLDPKGGTIMAIVEWDEDSQIFPRKLTILERGTTPYPVERQIFELLRVMRRSDRGNDYQDPESAE